LLKDFTVAAANLLALIDDIAAMLDDVALMTKVAAKKTAGVLGDDLALNAQQVAGVRAERELPVVWAVAKGSLINKAVLVPAALLISAFLPWAITPLLMLGGIYLCFEGAEKLAHKFLHKPGANSHQPNESRDAAISAPANSTNRADIDFAALEAEKIKGAIRTDFVLSIEIIVIALGTVANAPMPTQIAVLTAVAIFITVGVYGLVAAIVKLDDAGFYLYRQTHSLARAAGKMLLLAAPALMKLLAIAGTLAMFMVGGGILTHSISALVNVLGELLAVLFVVFPLGFLLAFLLNDVGLYLHKQANSQARAIGRMLLLAAPALIKLLVVAGTLGMFIASTRELPRSDITLHALTESLAAFHLGFLLPALLDVLTGFVAGVLTLGAVHLAQRLHRGGKAD
jgi:predicted DNA repair protein MutK